MRKAGIRRCVLRIALQRAVKVKNSFFEAFVRSFVELELSLKVRLVGRRICCSHTFNALPFEPGQTQLQVVTGIFANEDGLDLELFSKLLRVYVLSLEAEDCRPCYDT